ncbi:MAG TPA: tetratricopeptide repeat protein [Nitrospiraceae bacterium]|nr:tetratricopeptide repeat protein [Nitrospiraceae bacterium]
MSQNQNATEHVMEIDRLAVQLAKDPHSKAFMPLAEEYGKVGMWQEAAAVLEDGLKVYPGFITAMVALGRAYDHMGQATKAKAILEESVKLSPENLRAHRTLIKIYQNQGLNELALQSCAAILTVNPRDEEALSIQSALGGPLKHKKTPERPTPPASAANHPSVPVTTPSVLSTNPALKTPAVTDTPALTTEVRRTSSTDQLPPTGSLDTTRSAQDPSEEQVATPVPKPESQADESVVMPPPSPHADVVAQLESWLRSIESRRHDRDAMNEPPSSLS